MMGRHRGSSHKRGHRRGYSLLELVAVALLAAGLIALVGRWVGQLGQVALQQASTGLLSNSVVVADRLEDDLTAAVSCTGTDSPVREVTASRLEVYVADDDGTVDLVRWEVDTGTGLLTRAEAEAVGSCSYPPLSSGNEMIGSVATGSPEAPLFVPVSEADPTDPEGVYGICTDRDDARCRISALEVNLTVLDAGTPVVSLQVLPVGL
jgi:Tfp pilus assembly protein PilV